RRCRLRSGRRRGARVLGVHRRRRPWSPGRARQPAGGDAWMSAIDPVTLEVLWTRLIQVTNEQAAALMRTSFTPIVREVGDLSAAVFDARGLMLAQAVTGTPGHINALATGMKHFVAAYPPHTLSPGDVLITNDPWMTSGQLNDLSVVTPVFDKRKLIGFFGNTCHAIDIGGRGRSAVGGGGGGGGGGFGDPDKEALRRGEAERATLPAARRQRPGAGGGVG